MSNDVRTQLKLKYRNRLGKYAKKATSPTSDSASALAKLHYAGLDWFNAHETAAIDENLDEDLLYLCETAIPKHYRLVCGEVARLGLPSTTYQPSPMAFADIQRRVAKFQPEKVTTLRQAFVEENLPVHGFDHPSEASGPSTSKTLTVVINNNSGQQYLNTGKVGAMGEGASFVVHSPESSLRDGANRVNGPG